MLGKLLFLFLIMAFGLVFYLGTQQEDKTADFHTSNAGFSIATEENDCVEPIYEGVPYAAPKFDFNKVKDTLKFFKESPCVKGGM